MPKHATKTSWVKGQTGNPAGRSPKYRDVEELARQHTPEAIAALVMALKSPRERVPAAAILLDRAWGKPKQPIIGDKNMPLLVDFRWADKPHETSVVAEITEQVIEAVAEETDETDDVEIVWNGGNGHDTKEE